MWIVKLALRRPYTFVVASLLVVILGALTIRETPKDIFPTIDIPVVSIVWTYTGLSTQDMEKQITTFSEFSTSFAVNNIKSIESQTLNGVAVVKIYFQPGVDVAAAVAQVTAVSQTILRRMPPGTTPPSVIRYSASSVPILQLALSSDTMSESELYDYGIYRVRQQLAVVQGTTLPLPYGGAPRQIMVDLDPPALLAKGLSAQEVSAALNAQNLTLPTGTAKIGRREYTVSLNSSPDAIDALNNIPIRRVGGSMVFVRDVAHVHDGFAVQTSVVRRDGRRSVLLTVLKNGDASTLDVANRVKALLPTLRASAPHGLEIELLTDQSTFVSRAVSGVVVEGIVAAALTALMILLFLGSWRSTLIVTVSIPLSILIALLALRALGHTLNIMTLGGFALAVGILVDDATVEIENIHRNLAMGKRLRKAILDGAQQIAVPAFVATLSISIVFVSVLFLDGAPKYLFTPMALAVGLSVMASYFLSRTVVPTMVQYLLPAEVEAGHADTTGAWGRFHEAFNDGFERVRERYVQALEWTLTHRRAVFAVFGVAGAAAAILLPFVGRDFFPKVDAGQIRLHVTAPAGTRIEETEHYFKEVEDAIRRIIPERERSVVLDNIGVPQGINLAVTETSTISSADGEILVNLRPDKRRGTASYMREMRRRLPQEFPELSFYFQPADIVSQILNFGLSAPIDIQVAGLRREETYRAARAIEARVSRVPGAVDVHLHQVVDAPRLHVTVDRTRAAEVGLTQRDVANNVLVSLASSILVTPNFWTDGRSGIAYPIAVQVPPRLVESVDDLRTTALVAPGVAMPQLLGDLASVERRPAPVVANHSNIQPTFNVRADVQDTDLGAVSEAIRRIVHEYEAKLPPGSSITLRGQVESMDTSFGRLGLGLVFAALLVYGVMVVNFQSWTDPFIIITALPGALVGIVWMLFVTQTTFSVPSLMGAIMTIGVATANSILMVTFANDQRHEGLDAVGAALAAGRTRLRPVLMTAAAMIIGMLPMSLGLGEGGEQNAPLGRAVIGGLLVATAATLFFVPTVYTVLRGRPPQSEGDDLDRSAS
jgi:multidrug efflux pump subunit AcrB